MVLRGESLPTSRTHTFTTHQNNQRNVTVDIVHGDHLLARKNTLIGRFVLPQIRVARAGDVKIEITFSVDKNGLISVSAKDDYTGKTNQIKLQNDLEITQNEMLQIKQQKEEIRAETIQVHLQEILEKGSAQLAALEEDILLLSHTNSPTGNVLQRIAIILKDALSSQNEGDVDYAIREYQRVRMQNIAEIDNLKAVI
ncbi:hypothetical protein FACS1894166_10210 [Bacilli bacterium]|nr:hypothetical protein FACS1894166_10210 [Bacilli bacterium]